MTASVEETVLAVARYGLADDTDHTSTDHHVIEVQDGDVAAFLSSIEQNRIVGAAIRALIEDRLVLPPEGAEQLVSVHDDAMTNAMSAEVVAVGTSNLLTTAGIAHRVLDGVAIAHSGYDDPALRSFDDVSILVMANDIEKTIQLLQSEGATRPQSQVRPGFDRRFGDKVTLSSSGVDVHVHRTFCPGAFGVTMKPNDLFVLQRVIKLAGVHVPVLDPTDSVLHACYRLALGTVEPDLSSVRDLARLVVAGDRPSFDGDRFSDAVERWQGTAVVRHAARIVSDTLGLALPEGLSFYANSWVDRSDREALEAYHVEDVEDRETALQVTTFKALPMGERPSYALSVGLPEGADPIGRITDLISRRR